MASYGFLSNCTELLGLLYIGNAFEMRLLTKECCISNT